MIYSSWFSNSKKGNFRFSDHLDESDIKDEIFNKLKEKIRTFFPNDNHTNLKFITNIDGVSFLTGNINQITYLYIINYGLDYVRSYEIKDDLKEIYVIDNIVYFSDGKRFTLADIELNTYYDMSDFKELVGARDSNVIYLDSNKNTYIINLKGSHVNVNIISESGYNKVEFFNNDIILFYYDDRKVAYHAVYNNHSQTIPINDFFATNNTHETPPEDAFSLNYNKQTKKCTIKKYSKGNIIGTSEHNSNEILYAGEGGFITAGNTQNTIKLHLYANADISSDINMSSYNYNNLEFISINTAIDKTRNKFIYFNRHGGFRDANLPAKQLDILTQPKFAKSISPQIKDLIINIIKENKYTLIKRESDIFSFYNDISYVVVSPFQEGNIKFNAKLSSMTGYFNNSDYNIPRTLVSFKGWNKVLLNFASYDNKVVWLYKNSSNYAADIRDAMTGYLYDRKYFTSNDVYRIYMNNTTFLASNYIDTNFIDTNRGNLLINRTTYDKNNIINKGKFTVFNLSGSNDAILRIDKNNDAIKDSGIKLLYADGLNSKQDTLKEVQLENLKDPDNKKIVILYNSKNIIVSRFGDITRYQFRYISKPLLSDKNKMCTFIVDNGFLHITEFEDNRVNLPQKDIQAGHAYIGGDAWVANVGNTDKFLAYYKDNKTIFCYYRGGVHKVIPKVIPFNNLQTSGYINVFTSANKCIIYSLKDNFILVPDSRDYATHSNIISSSNLPNNAVNSNIYNTVITEIQTKKIYLLDFKGEIKSVSVPEGFFDLSRVAGMDLPIYENFSHNSFFITADGTKACLLNYNIHSNIYDIKTKNIDQITDSNKLRFWIFRVGNDVICYKYQNTAYILNFNNNSDKIKLNLPDGEEIREIQFKSKYAYLVKTVNSEGDTSYFVFKINDDTYRNVDPILTYRNTTNTYNLELVSRYNPVVFLIKEGYYRDILYKFLIDKYKESNERLIGYSALGIYCLKDKNLIVYDNMRGQNHDVYDLTQFGSYISRIYTSKVRGSVVFIEYKNSVNSNFLDKLVVFSARYGTHEKESIDLSNENIRSYENAEFIIDDKHIAMGSAILYKNTKNQWRVGFGDGSFKRKSEIYLPNKTKPILADN